MEIGIIGLAKSGKTTIFNALSNGTAVVSPYSRASKPNLGVAKVKDRRLTQMIEIFKPQREVHAEIRYVDFPSNPETPDHSQGVTGELLNMLEGTDAILQVVRAFQDSSIPHPELTVDPHRDLETMDMELSFADLGILERRINRLDAELKSARTSEKEIRLRERNILQKIKESLESGTPIREQTLSDEELKLLENFRFITAKPLLIVWNIDEGDIAQQAQIEEHINTKYSRPNVEGIVVCGKLEMELMEMNEDDKIEFRSAMGIHDSGLDRAIRESYKILGLVSFFTVGPDEVKAWTIPSDTTVIKAAGKIHSDIERGFIRAEVISYDDFLQCGTLSEGKKKGLLRLEGKTYKVQDGDILTILFNV